MVVPAGGAIADMSRSSAARGVLLVAHGSRDPAWAAPFEQVRERVAAHGIAVTLAYLERMTPDIDHAAGELAARGCTQVAVIPLLLGQGSHVRDDLPRLVAAAMGKYPSITLELTQPIGEDARVLDAIAATCIAVHQSP